MGNGQRARCLAIWTEIPLTKGFEMGLRDHCYTNVKETVCPQDFQRVLRSVLLEHEPFAQEKVLLRHFLSGCGRPRPVADEQAVPFAPKEFEVLLVLVENTR